MVQKASQMDPKKAIKKKQNATESKPKKVFLFFSQKECKFRVRTPKVIILHNTSLNSKKKC